MATFEIKLSPETEEKLRSQATARGLTLEQWCKKLIEIDLQGIQDQKSDSAETV